MALAGLLFVAVSISLGNILKGPTMLPARAAETLAMLLLIVVSSALSLVPQDVQLLGAEILIIARCRTSGGPGLVAWTWPFPGRRRRVAMA